MHVVPDGTELVIEFFVSGSEIIMVTMEVDLGVELQ